MPLTRAVGFWTPLQSSWSQLESKPLPILWRFCDQWFSFEWDGHFNPSKWCHFQRGKQWKCIGCGLFFQETPQSRMVLSPNRAYGIPQNCHVNEEYDDLPILTAGFSLFACSKKRTSLGSPLVVEASHSSPHSLSWASHCPSRKGHHACASLAVVDHKSKDPGNPKVKRCSRILGIQMTSQH